VPLRYPLFDVLEQMTYGEAILDWDGREVRLNSTATRLLAEHSAITEAGCKIPLALGDLQALVPVQIRNLSIATNSWFVVTRGKTATHPAHDSFGERGAT
jgi:hypothetical protein